MTKKSSIRGENSMSNWTDKRVEDWAREHFANAPVSGVWAPDGTGLIFLKAEERKWELVRAVDHDASKDTLSGIRALMFDLGYSLKEDDVEWDPAPETMEEANAIEESQRQDVANSWADEDGTKLIDMNPHNTYPKFLEEKEVLLDNGETETIEIWTYPLMNPNTGKEVQLDPDDYRMLTDDRHFMRFMNSEGTVYQALTRREIMDLANATARGTVITKDVIGFLDSEVVGSIDRQTLEKVPRWMWGTICGTSKDSN